MFSLDSDASIFVMFFEKTKFLLRVRYECGVPEYYKSDVGVLSKIKNTLRWFGNEERMKAESGVMRIYGAKRMVEDIGDVRGKRGTIK